MQNKAHQEKIYLEYFKGREDYFAIQATNSYKPVNKKFSENYLEKHLNKFATFGVYVLTKDSKCNFVCIDIDIPKSELVSIDFKDHQFKFKYLKHNLLKILEVFTNELGIDTNSILLEETGGRGYHLWLFFEEQIAGNDAVKLYHIIKSFTRSDFEFFPKQPSLDGKKLGNLIKLPLGIHQKYGSDSVFFKLGNEDIQLLSSQDENFEHLKTIRKISLQELNGIIGKHSEVFNNVKIKKFSPEKLTDSERAHYKSDLNFLFQKCEALRNLKNKAENGIEFSRNEIFHFANILLSVENSENFLLGKIKQSYGSKFSFDIANREIEKIKPLHPSSCKKLIQQGICAEYCNDAIKRKNLDPLLPNTNPLSFWLTPSKKRTQLSLDELQDIIADKENIINAYWKLKKYHKNEDTLFYDEFDFEFFEKNLEIYSRYISRFIKNKENIPFIGYLKVKTPKKVNKNREMQYRQMAYSSIFDQIIIQAIFNKVSLIFEQNFQKSSYGYKFNTQDLHSEDIFYNWKEFHPKFLGKVLEQLRDPQNKYYICCDIKGYYDHVDHNILIQQVKEYLHEDYIFKLIEKIIKLNYFKDKKDKGLPQGPAYARILANLYLNNFDKEIINYCSGYFRYVDDFFLFFESKEDAEKGLNKIIGLLSDLELSLSDDENKKPQIIETINDQKIIAKLDSLKYGIFEEFKFIDNLDVEQINDFYLAIKRHMISTSNFDEILDINNKLPSLIYLISKDFRFYIPLKKKIPAIVQYLVENKIFYPKRLKYIFYKIIDLMILEKFDMTKFYEKLDDTHKIYFLLSLYGIYKKNGKYENELRNTIQISLESENNFLKGFGIAINQELQVINIIENANIPNEILACQSFFTRIKMFNRLNYLELTPDIKAIFRERISAQSPYIERKYFLSNLGHRNTVYIDNQFISNLMTSDAYLLLPECCLVFSLIKDDNLLFAKLGDYIVQQKNYKDISLSYLKTVIFEEYKNAGEAELTNQFELYKKIKDPQTKRELINVINRIREKTLPANKEFAKNHSLLARYNEAVFYKNLNSDDKSYDFLELISSNKLLLYDYDDLDAFENDLKELAYHGVLPNLKIEIDTDLHEVSLKYSLPNEYEELRCFDDALNNKNELILIFELLDDIYKKALYFHKICKRIPLISTKSIFFCKSKKRMFFKNFASTLCPIYTLNGNAINNNNIDEIPRMLSFFLRELLFDNDDEKINEFLKAPKTGIVLFLSLFIKRMSSKDTSMRLSYPRFSYLVQGLKKRDIDHEFEISLFYFEERLKSNLFHKNKEGIEWLSICNALNAFYGDLAITYDLVNFSSVKFQNKTFLNFDVPRKLHYLSNMLLNISLNIENVLINSNVEKSSIVLFNLMNHYSILCIELMSLVKVGINSSEKNSHIVSLSLEKDLTLKSSDYTLILEKTDIDSINILLERKKSNKDLFDPSLNFTLNQISFLYLIKNFNITINDDTLVVENDSQLNRKYFDILVLNLLVRLQDIDTKIQTCVQRVLTDLKTNQPFKLSDDELKLKNTIMAFCYDLSKIRKKLKYKRYYGKNVETEKLPLIIFCRKGLWKKFKTDNNSMNKIPLINLYPSTSSKCSWDTIDNNIINLVIPNERVNKLVSLLKNGKLFCYKISYLYSAKAKIIWDITAVIVFAILAILTFVLLRQPKSDIIKGVFWLVGIVLSYGVVFFVKKIFKDVKFWSPQIHSIINYIKH